MDLQGQRIFIIGGSSGIGLATARLLAKVGADLTLTGRDRDKLDRALDALEGNAVGDAFDATSPEALASFFDRAGPFDHLVVALSGGRGGGPFATLDLGLLRGAFDGKFWAHVAAAQGSLKTLRPDGSITFVTAASARKAMPGTAGLAAINGALNTIVPTLALELKPLRVNAVSPGVIDTPWWDKFPADQREAAFANAAATAPVGRVGRPEDVAEAIVFVIGNGFMTGTIIDCDGGLRLS